MFRPPIGSHLVAKGQERPQVFESEAVLACMVGGVRRHPTCAGQLSDSFPREFLARHGY